MLVSRARNTATTQELRRGGDRLRVRQFCLRVLAGRDEGQLYRAQRERVSIGTHESNDFVLDDPAMSRFHCEIVLVGDRAMLRDLGSKNGTLVDGVAVEAAPLSDRATLALGRTRLRFELGHKRVEVPLAMREAFGGLVGSSPAMRAAFALLESAAAVDTTVLITGETGTGKDLAAEAIHRESARRDGPFVVVDCGATPPSLFGSYLFGHERGAFTGADRARAGAVELAHGGTLFLDEVGELAPTLQPQLLRMLETKRVQRIGGARPIAVDVRIVAATSRNLRAEVNGRRFRSDLYYRLAALEVRLPPLRERFEDLPLLVARFVAGHADPERRSALTGDAFFAELRRQSWPGNVRELRNFIERRLAFDRAELDETPLPSRGTPWMLDPAQPLKQAREEVNDAAERRYLEEVLQRCGNNVSKAAAAAGIARSHLYRLLIRHGLR